MLVRLDQNKDYLRVCEANGICDVEYEGENHDGYEAASRMIYHSAVCEGIRAHERLNLSSDTTNSADQRRGAT